RCSVEKSSGTEEEMKMMVLSTTLAITEIPSTLLPAIIHLTLKLPGPLGVCRSCKVEVDSRRKRGRPRTTWRGEIHRLMNNRVERPLKVKVKILTNSEKPRKSSYIGRDIRTNAFGCREDLSPQSSLNGHTFDGCDAKKKKGPAPRQQEELCLVCGDRASGYHYNALTCEGCKGFFRRSITKNAVYQCKYGNNCEIDMYMRRKCQECRLKKCLSVGMRPECVVPEYQCAVKRKEKKALKDKDKPNSTTNGSPEVVMMKESDTKVDTEKLPSVNGVKPVSPEQEELIQRLVYFQNEYESPSDDDLKRITNQPGDGEDQSDLKFRYITEITILTVQLIVEFAKRLPGFDKLLREDQIALLKACSSEVMMFRMARRYDVNSDSILFANNQPYTRDSYSLAGMGETIEDMLRFCRQMYAMKVDNAEYALLTAIVIFSDRPSLIEGWKVEKIQEIYLEALKAYVDNRRRPRSGTIFAKLLSVLTELRTLGNQNSEMCFSLKLKNKELPAFLAEIWDVTPDLVGESP
ncbi:hypothetical protein L9F63_017462, partial [Diploptera punctata]